MIKDLVTDKKHLFASGANTELRAQINRARQATLLNGDLVSNVRTETSGVSARVYENGIFGFSSTAEYTDESVREVLKAASENAAFLASHAGRGKGPHKPLPDTKRFTAHEINDLEQRAYIGFAKAVDAYIAEKYPDLISRIVVAMADSSEKLIAVSNGADVHWLQPRSFIYVQMAMEGPNGQPVELYDVIGGYGAFDANFKDASTLYERIDVLYDKLRQKANGVYPEAGVKTVIFSGTLAGMLAHEAVGHTVEADLVIGGSVAGPNLNKRVGSELVNLVDFAHTAFGKPVPLPVYADDEGVEATDAVLIKDGILVGYMNSRETAERFGMKPTGNARAYGFSDEPLIRMRNTAVLPGKSKLEDMIASVEDGYYLIDTNNGQADTTGEFMYGVTFGYEIKNGKLGRALLDTTISGVAFEMLKTVDMISDNMTWETAGMCGKKQPMTVSMGGPEIKCKVNIGGR
ncbi:MAG: TldD/PmbA family protein [Clostridiales bacterium]|nr:TldD/PmbA family protein [Clostridiales bacterium]